jgi:hypothetical protein
MSAREMFEELGYECTQFISNKASEIRYEKKDYAEETTFITIDRLDKTFNKFTKLDNPFEPSRVEDVTLGELKAIYQLFKELGLIE